MDSRKIDISGTSLLMESMYSKLIMFLSAPSITQKWSHLFCKLHILCQSYFYDFSELTVFTSAFLPFLYLSIESMEYPVGII